MGHNYKMIKYTQKIYGFTLLELLITLVIISILATISYPAYIHLQYRAHRADGQIALLNTAGYLEHYFSVYNTYLGVNMAEINAPKESPKGFYQIDIPQNQLTPTTYVITATPLKTQLNDKQCGVLAINNIGQKGREIGGQFETDESCWR